MMDCKKALVEADGDIEKATKILREKGIAKAAKKAGRETREGTVYSYIHPGGKIGTLVEINCETDFVARTDEFQGFAKDIAMQVAGHIPPPMYMTPDQVPEDELAAERDIYANQARNEGKPEKIIDKIVEGKVNNYYKQICLMDQVFIKDSGKTISDYVTEITAKLGENIQIGRFSRFRIGE